VIFLHWLNESDVWFVLKQ